MGHERIAGRADELSVLRRAITRSADGDGGAVLVHGEAGVGKTHLVRSGCAEAAQAGHRVLWGRCVNFGVTTSPYLPIISALEGWLAESDATEREMVLAEASELHGLLPSLGGAGQQPPSRLVSVIETVLTKIAAIRPVVLVVDDLQWADLTSLDVLAYVLSGMRRHRMTLVLTHRDEALGEGHPLHGWLAEVLRLPGSVEVPLHRFGFFETAEQLELLLGAQPHEDLVNAVLARSAGNPYLSELLVRGLEPTARGLDDDVPDALRGALLAAWHRLTPVAREVTRLLSVAGRPLALPELSAVADEAGRGAGADVAAAAREAVHAGVLRPDRSGQLWFRHPLLAEVLYGTLIPGEEAPLHAAFVRAFMRGEEPQEPRAADLAVHLERAGMYDEAFGHAVEAADRAAALQAFPEEAHLREAAARLWLRLSPDARDGQPSEAAMLGAAAQAARRAGDEQAAWSLVERARRVVDAEQEPLVASQVLQLWCQIGFTSGRMARHSLEYAREAVRLSDPFPDSEVHAAALAALAETKAESDLRHEAARDADAAVAAAVRSGSVAIQSLAHGTRSLVHLGESSAADDAETCYRLALQSGRAEIIALAAITRANVLEDRGDLAGCARVFSDGFEAASRVGLGGLGPLLATYAAHFLVVVGRMEEARAMLREALSTPRTSVMHVIQARQVAIVLALRTGHRAEATMQLERLREVSADFEEHVGLHGPAVLAEYLVGDGRYEEAIEVLGTQLEPHTTAEPKYGDVMLMWGARAAAELAVRARDRHDGPGQQHASAAVESLLTAREALPEGAFGGAHDDAFDGAMKAIFEAEHARCRGDADVAGRWEQAAAACAAAGTPWFEALASLRAAEARMAGGEDRARVAEPLRAAYRLATRMGAEPLREEAEAYARSAKISLLDPATVNATNTPTTALTRLTGRELEILRHLVAGRSYREIATALFISEKTVSAHVSNLLHKTGTRNRHEAAALARRHGVVVEPE